VKTSNSGNVVIYRVDFYVEGPREIQFRAFVTKNENNEFWLDQWDITQITIWGKHVKCEPDKIRPAIEPQFCICKNITENT